MSKLKSSIDFLNMRFLNVNTKSGEDRVETLTREINQHRKRLQELTEEYYRMAKTGDKPLDIKSLGRIMDKVPVLYNTREPVSPMTVENPARGVCLDIPYTHNNLTLDGTRLLYQTLPIYHFKILLPQAGDLQINNCTELYMATLDKRETFDGAVDYNFGGSYAHPHSGDRVRTFSNFCVGNNPFLDMYRSGKIKTLRDLSEFIIYAVRWVQTTNLYDLYSGSPLYKMIGFNKTLRVSDEMLHKVVLPTLKELINKSDFAPQYFTRKLRKSLEELSEDSLYIKVLLKVIAEMDSEEDDTLEPPEKNYILEKFLYGSYLISNEFQRKTDIPKLHDGNIRNSIHWDMLLIASGNMPALFLRVARKHYEQLVAESRTAYDFVAQQTGLTTAKELADNVQI